LGRLVFHGNGLAGVHHFQRQAAGVLAGQFSLDFGLIAHQNNVVAKFAGGLHGPGYIRPWMIITSHCINNNFHRTLLA
jgi:hypothetical protein